MKLCSTSDEAALNICCDVWNSFWEGPRGWIHFMWVSSAKDLRHEGINQNIHLPETEEICDWLISWRSLWSDLLCHRLQIMAEIIGWWCSLRRTQLPNCFLLVSCLTVMEKGIVSLYVRFSSVTDALWCKLLLSWKFWDQILVKICLRWVRKSLNIIYNKYKWIHKQPQQYMWFITTWTSVHVIQSFDPSLKKTKSSNFFLPNIEISQVIIIRSTIIHLPPSATMSAGSAGFSRRSSDKQHLLAPSGGSGGIPRPHEIYNPSGKSWFCPGVSPTRWCKRRCPGGS